MAENIPFRVNVLTTLTLIVYFHSLVVNTTPKRFFSRAFARGTVMTCCILF